VIYFEGKIVVFPNNSGLFIEVDWQHSHIYPICRGSLYRLLQKKPSQEIITFGLASDRDGMFPRSLLPRNVADTKIVEPETRPKLDLNLESFSFISRFWRCEDPYPLFTDKIELRPVVEFIENYQLTSIREAFVVMQATLTRREWVFLACRCYSSDQWKDYLEWTLAIYPLVRGDSTVSDEDWMSIDVRLMNKETLQNLQQKITRAAEVSSSFFFTHSRCNGSRCYFIIIRL